MKHFFTIQNNKGFTLAEMLMGIMIFMIAFLSVSKLQESSLSDIAQTRKLLTAKYLAVEGLEYIKNMKDTYQNDGLSFTDFSSLVAQCQSQSFGCNVSYDYNYWSEGIASSFTSLTPIYTLSAIEKMSISGGPTDALTISGNNALWNHTVDSSYSRVIIFEDVSSSSPVSYAYKVTSTVYFDTGYGTENKVEMSEIINFDNP